MKPAAPVTSALGIVPNSRSPHRRREGDDGPADEPEAVRRELVERVAGLMPGIARIDQIDRWDACTQERAVVVEEAWAARRRERRRCPDRGRCTPQARPQPRCRTGLTWNSHALVADVVEEDKRFFPAWVCRNVRARPPKTRRIEVWALLG